MGESIQSSALNLRSSRLRKGPASSDFRLLPSSHQLSKTIQDVWKSEGNRFQHDGGHLEEDAESEERQGGRRRQREGPTEQSRRAQCTPQEQRRRDPPTRQEDH